jgi:hypothetical protein
MTATSPAGENHGSLLIHRPVDHSAPGTQSKAMHLAAACDTAYRTAAAEPAPPFRIA